jgi:hypothetical protein
MVQPLMNLQLSIFLRIKVNAKNSATINLSALYRRIYVCGAVYCINFIE